MVQLNNYNFICEGRKDRTGGGIGLYIRNESNFKLRKDLEFYGEGVMESLFVEQIIKWQHFKHNNRHYL